EKCDSRSLYIALSAFFFSFIEEKKNQKEELSGSFGCSALCGVRVRALPRHPAAFWKRRAKTFALFATTRFL
ncbi:MAG: hypothetical protein K6A33_01980, partial [Clostridiales bacterium]|nr:hypothetical protein [Clostridiales bacterium]